MLLKTTDSFSLRQGSYTADQLATEIEFWLNTQYDTNGRTKHLFSKLSKQRKPNQHSL